MSQDQVIVAALGRPFKLGTLYDARKDQFVQGGALWESAALQRMTHRRPQPYSNFKISASDSIEEKASLLEVQASLRASVLCGLAEADGSAKYLHDKQQFKNQCRVTLQYKATTHFKQLCLTAGDWDNVHNRDMIEAGLATHVVTGIEYGANAFFVFDSHILEASDVHEFKLKIQAVIHILLWSVHFDYSRDLTDEQKSIVQTLKVKFYSDFLLEKPPATFMEAMQTYTDMTKLLGEHDKNAVPVKVWMMPLKYLHPKAAQIVRPISVGLVIEAEDTIEELDSVKMRCNDCLSVSAVGKFPQLHHQLQRFYRLCHYYRVELQRQMAETCPAIRDGTKTEYDLRQFFNQRLTSPFSQDRLTQWLKDKEREISVVQFCLEIMKGVPVLSTEFEIDSFVMTPDKLVCCGYIFTSLGDIDHQINDMEACIDQLTEDGEHTDVSEKSDKPWFHDNKKIGEMRDMATEFMKKKTSLFVAAIEDTKHPGSFVYMYEGGVRVDTIK